MIYKMVFWWKWKEKKKSDTQATTYVDWDAIIYKCLISVEGQCMNKL